MLNGAMPIFTAVVSTALLRTARRRQALGLLVGSPGSPPSRCRRRRRRHGAGGRDLVLAATICYAFSTNIVAPLHRSGPVPVIARQWVATLVVLPYGLGGGGSEFAVSSLLATWRSVWRARVSLSS